MMKWILTHDEFLELAARIGASPRCSKGGTLSE